MCTFDVFQLSVMCGALKHHLIHFVVLVCPLNLFFWSRYYKGKIQRNLAHIFHQIQLHFQFCWHSPWISILLCFINWQQPDINSPDSFTIITNNLQEPLYKSHSLHRFLCQSCRRTAPILTKDNLLALCLCEIPEKLIVHFQLSFNSAPHKHDIRRKTSHTMLFFLSHASHIFHILFVCSTRMSQYCLYLGKPRLTTWNLKENPPYVETPITP